MDWTSIKIKTVHDRLMYADWLEEQGESESLVSIIRDSIHWKVKRTTHFYNIFLVGPPEEEVQCALYVSVGTSGKILVEFYEEENIKCFMIDGNGFSVDNDKNWTWLLGYLKAEYDTRNMV